MATALPGGALVREMCDEAGPYQHQGVDILDFVQHVWGLDREIGQQILKMDLALDPAQLYTYQHSSDEGSLCQPFIGVANWLVGEVATKLDLSREDVPDSFWTAPDGTPLDGEEHEGEPNLIGLWKAQYPSDGERPSLSIAKHILEFKHHRFKATEPRLSPEHKTRVMQTFRTGSITRIQIPRTGCRPLISEKRVNARPSIAHSLDCTPNANSRKRKYECNSDASEDEPPGKRARFDHRAQLASYATACLAATSRRWVTGLLVDTFEVTACLFDRHLVACSTSFRFDQHPQMLAFVLYAMNTCTKDQAGFDPHLLPSPFTTSSPESQGEDPSLPVAQVIGSYFDFSSKPTEVNVPEDAREASGGCTGTNGAEGRWTEEDKAENPRDRCSSTCFRVTDFIHKPDELIGRATVVYKVRRRLSNGDFEDEPCALKFSWPAKARTSEIEVIKHLKKVLPTLAHEHFPHLFFSKTWTAKEMNLPWLGLGLSLNEGNHRERVLRGLATKYYKRLWEAGTIANFRQAWLDCVEFCYLAFKIGRVLHRDLSESNLMVLPLPDGKVKGVLNDWDMAQFLDDEIDERTTSDHHTGTPPFTAIDLLPQIVVERQIDDAGGNEEDDTKDDSEDESESEDVEGGDKSGWVDFDVKHPQSLSLPRHELRHHLESLFYILVWAALHYNLKKGTRDSETNPLVAHWTRDAEANINAKKVMLSFDVGYGAKLKKALKREFRKSELAQWIESLRVLFAQARDAYKIALYTNQDIDSSTYGGRLTFKTFMAAINVTPRSWGLPGYLDEDT